ncbi:hypothetical protein NEUTE1DRAFT_97324 [Neurospora tetrasperma FGSC 2508]|uniref:Nephrocystin 3-like N-terminal domain-containing protein n=1 Tax=Neurospora tetrasperma (strain FGSC 2508 / ATCC MYA-4615 / P0657) TaxID=510951 RepID=F8MAI9_NEUT8|nr:uncharacterized protein NEUTE1DRAFT_97324 [Neurospora tetrasperma FGSC 2508]EGO60110.1 hypothetical protein NEUTE1DRAFT_97324 [Neurospora tetrasperma FGSC 2508]EGZ75941.1 hypothetical protein NEUTE2DRAFT_58161 [Neurospora tetrasperma FGSC 2509]
MEGLITDLYPLLPPYTRSETLPPAYTLPTPTTSTSNTDPDGAASNTTASGTERAIYLPYTKPIFLDTFLTLELLTRLIRCIKAALRISRSNGDGHEWWEKMYEVSMVLAGHPHYVTITKETNIEAKRLVNLTRNCSHCIREYAMRDEVFVRTQQAWGGGKEMQNRVRRRLEAIDTRLLGKEYLGKLCSPEEAQSLIRRTDFEWIKNNDRYLHDLIRIISMLNHPAPPAMVNRLKESFDAETEDVFIEAMRKPAFAEIRERVMQSLLYSNRNSRFEAVSEPCTGTCQWILNAPIADAKETFGTWLKAPDLMYLDRRFWISGDPGTGESVLMKYLVMETQRNPAILKRPEDEETPIVLSHFFDHDGDLMHRTTQGMLLNLLFQLFEQNPVLIDTHFHHLVSDTREWHRAQYKTSAKWEGHELWDLLWTVLRDVKERRKKIFIFIDGPSGFDLKPPSPAYPKHEDIPRDITDCCLPDMQPWLKPEPTQLIHSLNYYTDAKMIVTARPEGIFHQTHWKLQLHLEPSLLRHDIKTVCHHTLDHLWFNQRYSFTRKVLSACNGSFTEVLDALDRIKRQTSSSSSSSDLPPPLPLSELLYSSLLTQFHSSHTKLEIHSLSRILDLLLTDHLYSLYTLRSNRPLSLLQLTLCLHDHLIHNCLLKGSFQEPPDIRSTCKSVKKQIQERLYPFITLRKMDHTPIPGDKVDKILEMDCTVPVPESTMEVCFLQPSLVEFLTKTEQGRELLRLDEVDPPRLADVEARREWVRSALIGGSQGGMDGEGRKGELVRDRLKLLLRAGMFEEIVLWRALHMKKDHVERMASELGRVYREYVRFAERSTVLGYLREEEVFPERWVVKFANGN